MMEDITNNQKEEFAQNEFPGKPINLGDGNWWYIQAGNIMGEFLHYEYWGGKVSLHIEGPDWRPFRNYLRNQIPDDDRILRSHWGRQDCSWTLNRTPNNWEEIKQCFIEIDRIMRPHILSFERLQGFKKHIDTNEQSEDVNAIKVKLIELIENKRIHIPEYQRPYRWTQKNVEQLLEDINTARLNGKTDYLIGSVILHINDYDGDYKLEIVDGQQRLTTICLIAKVLGCHNTLPSLRYSHHDSFYHIKENYTFIKDWIALNIADGQNFLDYIFYNCQFVQITVQKLQEAFQLFETQNGRGKELEAYNLLKAFHIRAMLDSSTQDKIDCDVRWEDAALFVDGSGNRMDLLRQLINEHLYRTRIWSRNGEAEKFTRKDVEEFKGLTIGRDNQLDFAYQNILVQQQIAAGFMQSMNQGLFKVKSRFEHGDPDNMSPFVSINQMIINGRPFFEYIETYIEIYKRLFVQAESSQLALFKNFYNDYCLYSGCHRAGDSYVRQVYKSAIILLFDRFGEKGINYLYKDLYICVYRMRLEKKQIRYTSMCKLSTSGYLFNAIQNAKNISDLANIKRKANEFLKNTNMAFVVPAIKNFFEENK